MLLAGDRQWAHPRRPLAQTTIEVHLPYCSGSAAWQGAKHHLTARPGAANFKAHRRRKGRPYFVADCKACARTDPSPTSIEPGTSSSPTRHSKLIQDHPISWFASA
jgi:hypothetical protein